jgi:DDE superfamily endonuclease
LKPWQHEQWWIPQASAEFVAALEDVLDLYAQPYDPARPVVCLDEKPVVLHAAARPSRPAAPGQVERRAYEYVRQGTAAVFVLVEPLGGWRHYAPGERRTAQDYAALLRYLADTVYPDAHVIRLVQDNLNTHGPAALYGAFPPAQAHRLRQRFEFHPTPKHGSWLNMAAIEISILARGCLSRACPDRSGHALPPRRRLGSRAQRRATRHYLAVYDGSRSRTLASALPRSENQTGLSTRLGARGRPTWTLAVWSSIQRSGSFCTLA